MTFPRASGLLLHPTSLPSSFGIGDLGESAYQFVDFLCSSSQKLWQVLPLGPTGYGDSPYSCYSAFAGNTLLISPQRLVPMNLLTEHELAAAPAFKTTHIDFEKVYEFKSQLLSAAFQRFSSLNDLNLRAEFDEFCCEQRVWLDDYAMFQALKVSHDGKAWNEWEPSLAHREPTALAEHAKVLRDQISQQKFYQWLFFKQWLELKSYCNARGVSLIGDIPIFIAHDSADVWTNPRQFKLDHETGKPLVVAGVPPDYFSKTGQLWGNPIYDWEQMQRDGFAWWIKRVRSTLKLVDVLRIDHFRGFEACWEIPAGDPTAEGGTWVDAPGRELLSAIRTELGTLPIIAEDLGVITPEVEKLRDDFGFPGMRVLQFAFGSDSNNLHLPHNYNANVVAYTGTHDNDTTLGWFESLDGDDARLREREFALKYVNSHDKDVHWDFIRAVISSCANTAIIPLQDVLGLGTEARMNLPNSTSGNWSWRFREKDLTPAVQKQLSELTKLYGR